MKVVINRCYGGFNLSQKGLDRYNELANELASARTEYAIDIARNDTALVQVVEELGSGSWAPKARLKIVEIPDDIKWEIVSYDGIEHAAEIHRSWH